MRLVGRGFGLRLNADATPALEFTIYRAERGGSMTATIGPRLDSDLGPFLEWCRRRETLPLLHREDLALWARQSPDEFATAVRAFSDRWTRADQHGTTKGALGVDELTSLDRDDAAEHRPEFPPFRVPESSPIRSSIADESTAFRDLTVGFSSQVARRTPSGSREVMARLRMYPWD